MWINQLVTLIFKDAKMDVAQVVEMLKKTDVVVMRVSKDPRKPDIALTVAMPCNEKGKPNSGPMVELLAVCTNISDKVIRK